MTTTTTTQRPDPCGFRLQITGCLEVNVDSVCTTTTTTSTTSTTEEPPVSTSPAP